jgi:hypothetical protein
MMGTAQADYQFCPTTGDVCSTATGALVGATETYTYDFDFQFGGTTPDWGSPGVSAGETTYGESMPALGMIINFNDGTIDPSQITIGNAANCAGTTTGGTTFCTSGPTDIWEAFQTSASSMEFLAQDPSFFLSEGQDYFVNIFFTSTSVLPTSFTGEWLTELTAPTPEPGTLAMLGVGLVGVILAKRRRRA